MKLYVIANKPFHYSIKLTEGKPYEVISYLEDQGNKLFLIQDDNQQVQTLNLYHFKDVIFAE